MRSPDPDAEKIPEKAGSALDSRHGRCGADRLLTVSGSAPETFAAPGGTGRERDAAGSFAEDAGKARGRAGQRSASVLAPPGGLAGHPGVSLTARATRCREPLKKRPDDAGKDWTGTACLITSLDAEAASPEDPLRLNRGRRAVRNMNRRCGGDACLTRTGSGPANRAGLGSMAPAVVFAGRRGAESPAQTRP